MKFINNIPQFDFVLTEKATLTINRRLHEAFAERVCVKCLFFRPDYDERGEFCLILNKLYGGKIQPETFSCAAWAKKEG